MTDTPKDKVLEMYRLHPDMSPEDIGKKLKISKRRVAGYISYYTAQDCDRYGVKLRTKAHKAIEMYEAGADPRDVKAKLNHENYNPLKKLSIAGHSVDKEFGSDISRTGRKVKRILKIVLTHKDDLPRKRTAVAGLFNI